MLSCFVGIKHLALHTIKTLDLRNTDFSKLLLRKGANILRIGILSLKTLVKAFTFA